ncbi:hypothetical protein [Mycoplana sp. MJR14]|nr:hypothetical protein [Mycoplana sp. MJR14]MDF1635619.1 hypothetical protein [Mycoplana sp. MJR14]
MLRIVNTGAAFPANFREAMAFARIGPNAFDLGGRRRKGRAFAMH